MAQTPVQSLWKPILKSAKIATVNRILGILIRLITIPLLINHLGMERYGFWITIASFSAYTMILDCGISLALVNRLTCLYTASDRESAEAYITSAFTLLGVIAICCAAVSLMVIPVIDWGTLFKLSSMEVRQETVVSVLIALLMFLLQLPFSVILKVPYSMQIGWLSETYQILGTVMSFAGIVFGVLAGAGLPILVFFLAGSAVFAGFGLLIHLLISGEFRLIPPSLSTLRKHIRELKSSGLDFMMMQTVSMLMNSLQFTLLAIYHGAETVALYGLITQVLMALQVPFSVLQQPMWTRMSQLAYHSKFNDVKRMLMKYIKYACGYSVAASCFMVFMVNPILGIVLHKSIFFPLALRFAFAVACTLGLVAGGGVGTVLLALNLSRPMALIALLQLFMFLGCVLAFVPRYGAIAMVSSISLTYIISIPASYWLIRKRLWEYAKQSSGRRIVPA